MTNCFSQLSLLIWKILVPWKRIWWKKLLYIGLKNLLVILTVLANTAPTIDVDESMIKRVDSFVSSLHLYPEELKEDFKDVVPSITTYKSEEELIRSFTFGSELSMGLSITNWDLVLTNKSGVVSYKLISPVDKKIDPRNLHTSNPYTDNSEFQSYDVKLAEMQLTINNLIKKRWVGSPDSFQGDSFQQQYMYIVRPGVAAYDGLISGEFRFLIGLSLNFMYVSIFLSHLHTLVQEKESRIKDTLKIMGMTPWVNDFSHIIVGFLESVVTFTIAVILLTCVSSEMGTILQLTSPALLLLFLCYFILYYFLFAAAISVVFETGMKAIVGGLFLFLMISMLKMTANSYLKDYVTYLYFLPGIPLLYFLEFLVKLEVLGLGLNFKTISFKIWNDEYEKNGCVLDILLSSLLSFIIFIVVIIMNNIGWLSLYHKIKSLFHKGNLDDIGDVTHTISEKYFEADPKGLNAGIEIRNLCKDFGHNRVVNNVSLNIYEGQITVLLGHNGAGKSTTMSMITGLLHPSNGTVFLNGYDIVLETDKARESLGLCPQHDILFNLLTIEEHLLLASKLKNFPMNKIKSEIEETLKAVNLTEKRNELAKNLSGGMKRRLSLAMAFVGGSQIVVLDEPSSGLDPNTRREIWKLLQNERKRRTILMTTHFMDEADALGDRIAIMSSGVIQCVGSSFFLKSVYGAGYHLNLLKARSDCDNNSVLNFIKGYVENAFIESSTKEVLQILLQLDDGNSNSTFTLSQLFKSLDQNLSSLNIQSYGLSVTTMEEVFLKVGNLYEANEKKKHSSSSENRPNLTAVTKVPFKCFHQLLGLFVKRCLYTMKKPLFLFMQITIPSLIFFLLIYFAKPSEKTSEKSEFILLSKDLYEQSSVLYDNRSNSATKKFLQQFENSAYVPFENHPKVPDNPRIIETELNSVLMKYWKQFAKKKDGIVQFRRQFRVGLMTETNLGIIPMCIRASRYSCCVAINHLINSNLPADKKIETFFKPIPLEDENMNMGKEMYQMFLISLILLLCLMLLCATFSYFIVLEKISDSRHLQMITGANLGTYWMSSIIWDYFIYLIFVAVVYVIFSKIDLGSFTKSCKDIIGLLIIAGFAHIPFVYFLSALFKTPSSSLLGLSALLVISAFPMILNLFLKNNKTFKKLYGFISPPALIFNLGLSFEGIDKEVSSAINVYLVQAPILILILFFKEYNIKVSRLIWGWLCQIAAAKLSINSHEDDDIQAERTMINSKSERELSNSYTIVMKNVSYFYGRFCPSFCAVNRVCLSVSPGECFGLLGVNGAGKTTTFNMLTGKETVSIGNAFINGKKLSTDFLFIGQQNMGYCPQFDALPFNLTGIEVLTFYARMRGVEMSMINQHVIELVDMLGLSLFANKVCMNYSGGNKRKLSVGVAMVGWPDLICLDEPSTGMDPEAKRFMWNTLIRYREAGKTIVLTSHSLEECEALCTRLVIMVNGELKCIGSSQHLKNKFGSGYSVQIQLDAAADDPSSIEQYTNNKNQVIQLLSKTFDSVELKDDHHGLLFFHIGKSQNFSLWQFFDVMESNKSNLKIQNYNISQSTLEQVFIDFARTQNESETNRQVELCTCCKKKKNQVQSV